MNKKIISYILIIFCIGSIINPIMSSEYLNGDEVDQKQNKTDGIYLGVSGQNSKMAQSFKPTLNIITRVQFILKISGSPDGLEISIREDLNGEDLTSIYKENEDITTTYPGGYWYEFDFPDAVLIPEKTYYIIWSPHGATSQSNTYYWSIKSGDLYDRGEAWKCIDGEWIKLGSSDFLFQTFGYLNSAPVKPYDINGPLIGEIGENLYYESTFNDPDGDEMNVLFDWGDGTDSGWIPSVSSGTFGLTHAWNSNGVYQIKTKAKDDFLESDWSDPLIVIIGNIPPDKPDKPNGPNSVKIRKQNFYSTSTTDLNRDEIFFMFDWGDGTHSEWLGPYESGDTCEAGKTWDIEGTYDIKVRAKDQKDAESPWSDPLSVTIPRKKNTDKQYDSNLSNGIWLVRGLFRYIEEDDDYIYLRALYSKIFGFEKGTLHSYRIFITPIKILKPFYGFLSKNSLPFPGFGICRDWDYNI